MGRAAARADKTVVSDDCIRFGFIVRTETVGGYTETEDGTTYVYDAKIVTLYIAAETDFVSYRILPDKSINLKEICEDKIEKAVSDGYEKVFDEAYT